MESLIRRFLSSGGLWTFVILQLFNFYLVVNFNSTQADIWLETKSVYGSAWSGWIESTFAFLDVERENELLRRENADLLGRIPGSAYPLTVDTVTHQDTAFQQRFTYLAGRIVNKSAYSPYNTMVINRGADLHQVAPGQGVVTDGGLLGIVTNVSARHARLMSILHLDTRISGGLKNNAFGTLRWRGKDPRRMVLTDIPDHVTVNPNDTVFTTGYSNVFPSGLPIGLVEETTRMPGTGSKDLTVRLLVDPLTATTGYIVRDLFKEELDILNQTR